MPVMLPNDSLFLMNESRRLKLSGVQLKERASLLSDSNV